MYTFKIQPVSRIKNYRGGGVAERTKVNRDNIARSYKSLSTLVELFVLIIT